MTKFLNSEMGPWVALGAGIFFFMVLVVAAGVAMQMGERSTFTQCVEASDGSVQSIKACRE